MKTKKLCGQKIKAASIFLAMMGTLLLILALTEEKDVKKSNANDMPRITFAMYGDERTQNIVEEVAEIYMQLKNCEVEVYCYSTEEELRTKVVGQFAAGKAFDVFYTDVKTLAFLQNGDWLYPLDDVVEKHKENGDEFYSAVLRDGNINGKQYAIPIGVMPYMIYYNKTYFEIHNMKDPQMYFDEKSWNYDNFATCITLLEQEIKKPVLEITESLKEFSQHNIVKYANEDSDTETGEEKFARGELPMVIADLNMTRICNAVNNFEWDIIPFPSQESDFTNSVYYIPFIAASQGEKELLVKDFIDFYTSSMGQKIRLEHGECLFPSLNMTFYTSMGDVKFPDHSNYYFYAIEYGYPLVN